MPHQSTQFHRLRAKTDVINGWVRNNLLNQFTWSLLV